MRLVRSLQHWLSGTGPRLHIVDFVPATHLLRQWADTFPWAPLVAAVEHSFAQRFPKRCGRAPVPVRVLALELLKHALGATDEDICHRLRTGFSVMYACGLREYQAPRSQAHFVLPETLCEFRGRMNWARRSPLQWRPKSGRLPRLPPRAAPEVERLYTRTRELCERVGEPPQLFRVLWGLRMFYNQCGE